LWRVSFCEGGTIGPFLLKISVMTALPRIFTNITNAGLNRRRAYGFFCRSTRWVIISDVPTTIKIHGQNPRRVSTPSSRITNTIPSPTRISPPVNRLVGRLDPGMGGIGAFIIHLKSGSLIISEIPVQFPGMNLADIFLPLCLLRLDNVIGNMGSKGSLDEFILLECADRIA
jgi:hypothetical protein